MLFQMKLAVVEQRWSTSERQGRSGREELEREQQRLKDANETIGTLRRSHEHLQAELSRAQDRITVLERDAEAHVGALDATKEQLGKVAFVLRLREVSFKETLHRDTRTGSCSTG